MAQTYDLNDPTDIAILHSHYDNYSAAEWQAYIDFTNLIEHQRAFTYKERECLINMAKQAGKYKRPADKYIRWGLSLAERIDNLRENIQKNEMTQANLNQDQHNAPTQNVTFRVAWHDNKWDGSICKDPLKNRYCSGFHSLLSERLRKRKEKNLDNEIRFQGKPVTDEYIPPCFWSINLFGSDQFSIKHDNPAEPKLDQIKEQLPAYSMFSWPFAVSFSRTKEQTKTDGAYPKNLETVRIPNFQAKLKPNQSVAFMYAKYSNPLTEEDQQYLVVGCGLVTDMGEPTLFEPQSIIDEKRKNPKYRNFPKINWALRYSFQNPNLLIRIPYHEYLEHINQPGFDEDAKQSLLNKIKVAITEPELNHCFKYVAMTIDDDEAIFILSKIRKQLIDCKDDDIVPPSEMAHKISVVEELLGLCWQKRGYFPGFSAICRSILNWDKPDFLLDQLIPELKETEQQDYHEKFIALIEDPGSDRNFRKFSSLLRKVKEIYEENYGLSTEQFLQLCMLNLKPFQFERVLRGKLKLSGDWRKTITEESSSHSITDICNNPYLLYEDYQAYESLIDPVTGEEKDGAIDLFKIDIAYFPDQRMGVDRIEMQRQMRNTDKRRLRGLVIRYLRTLENTGHCFADATELENAIRSYPLFYNLGTEYQLPERYFERIKNDVILHFEENKFKLKVIAENETYYFYLNEVYQAEGEIEKLIQYLLQSDKLSDTYANLESYLNQSCTQLKEKLQEAFDEMAFREERLKLYQNIYQSRLFVLAGNPGSGKSYELLNIVKDWQNKSEKCLLLTPTGKAALRLKTDKDFSGIQAMTIDKFLADVKSGKLPKPALFSYHNIIIDEMSMVDLMKLRNLFRQIKVEMPSFKRMIFVGDPHQLPAIGYGKVLRDVLYYLKTNDKHRDCCIELQTNCRQEIAESKILEFSEGFIKDGEISADLIEKIASNNIDISKGFRMHFWNTEDELYQKIDAEFKHLCMNRTKPIEGSAAEQLHQLFELNKDGSLPSYGNMDLEYFQILTPYKSDFFGSSQINDYVQEHYKPNEELSLMDNWFKQSDKIIRTKNYYEEGKLLISNGSIGLIRKDAKDTLLHFLEVDHPMSLKGDNAIRKGDWEFFDLAYAITVHKAQGSGFNHCFIILPRKTSLLSKELIYTALTRSRESITLFVQGNPHESFEKSVLGKAQLRSYTESRRTTLLLDKPYRYYALEVDGIFLNSRVELLIYQALKEAQKEYGEDMIKFEYELKPQVNGHILPMKTDFTVITPHATWYWEHLGRLGNKSYEWTWHNIKRKTYEQHHVQDNLITTSEINGINPDKIKTIIELIADNLVDTEDRTNRYSLHHYSLR